ncbi:uncharacterized protein JCM6883_003537 [Sporobolomyces salmoneus]|uniref:uncharacterized protein n=1 Tax=Sporobolomyces salmoneus TaxID=183962 RepID=UPI00317FC5EA
MSTRFDTRAIGHPPTNGKADVADRPSLKAFQAEIEKTRAKREETTVTTGTTELEDKVKQLSVQEEESSADETEDGRTLLERLIEPDESSTSALTSLLDRALHKAHGEIVLELGPHSLSHKTLASIFDRPDPLSQLSLDEVHLPRPQVDQIVSTLKTLLSDINASVSILHNPFDEDGRISKEKVKLTETESSQNSEETVRRWSGKSLRLMVRRKPDGAEDLLETRVAVVGNVDAGKSSLLGVLTKSRLDDGRGRARVSLFRHKHEIETGRTSSAGNEILGFTPDSQVIVPDEHGKQQANWEAIAAKAGKVVSFTDLAGHERYLKTTLAGLTGSGADFVLLIVGANAGLIGMSKEHLSVALALSLPIVVVVTKVDMTPAPIFEQTVKQLQKVLRSPGCRKKPVFVKDAGMAAELAANFSAEKAAPIFTLSSVTGESLDLLKTFLNVVRPVTTVENYPVDANFEFSIDSIFSVPFTGTVVSGVVMAGRVRPNDTVLLGPDSLNAFHLVAIKSIQRKRVNVDYAEAGQSVSFALKRIKKSAVRKGMVLLGQTSTPPVPVRRFEGLALVLYHNTLITERYQAMLHSGTIRQTIQVESIVDKPSARTGDRCSIVFRFLKHSEYLKVGDRFLFREGRCKALGVVTKILPEVKP